MPLPENIFILFYWTAPEGGFFIWGRTLWVSACSDSVCEVEDHSFGLCPTEAGVGDGLAVNAAADRLCAVLDVALYHEALDHALYLMVIASALDDLAYDAGLCERVLAGVCMVGIDDDAGVCKLALIVSVNEVDQVLVVVVRHGLTVFIHIAAQDGMRVGIALRMRLPAAVDEGVLVLCGGDGVEHYREVAARRVLHSDRSLETARGQTVLLILYRTRADSDVCEHIVEVLMCLGIEHLIRAGKAGLAERSHVQLADGDDTLEQVGLCARVGLMKNSLVAVAGRTGLVGVDTGDDVDTVDDLVLKPAQTRDVVDNAVLVVCRAGSDDKQETIVLAGEYLLYLVVSLLYK